MVNFDLGCQIKVDVKLYSTRPRQRKDIFLAQLVRYPASKLEGWSFKSMPKTVIVIFFPWNPTQDNF